MKIMLVAVMAAASCASLAQGQSGPSRVPQLPVFTTEQAVLAAGGSAPASEAATAAVDAARAGRTVAGLRPNPVAQGQIENIYSLKVINKTQQRQEYRLSLVDGDGFELQGKTALSLAPGEIVDVPVSVAMTTERPASSSQTLSFRIEDSDEPQVYSVANSRFVAPMNR